VRSPALLPVHRARPPGPHSVPVREAPPADLDLTWPWTLHAHIGLRLHTMQRSLRATEADICPRGRRGSLAARRSLRQSSSAAHVGPDNERARALSRRQLRAPGAKVTVSGIGSPPSRPAILDHRRSVRPLGPRSCDLTQSRLSRRSAPRSSSHSPLKLLSTPGWPWAFPTNGLTARVFECSEEALEDSVGLRRADPGANVAQ
jgi:hypothetical protein